MNSSSFLPTAPRGALVEVDPGAGLVASSGAQPARETVVRDPARKVGSPVPARLQEAVENERRRLARGIHSGVGQTLAAIRLQAEIIEAELSQPSESVRQAIERIEELTVLAMAELRAVAHSLHPPDWQRVSLADALRSLWRNSGVAERYNASLTLDSAVGDPPLEHRVLLYRAFQEGLSNSLKHARAASIRASLVAHGRSLVLTLEDDGVGLAATKSRSKVQSGIGLRSLREQAAELGARLSLESRHPGVRLTLVIPK